MSGQGPPTFGVLLRRYRKAAGLTQEDLAERALLSVFTISALERGTNQSPRKETLALLAEALGLEASARAALESAAHATHALPDTPRAVPTGSIMPLVGREAELAALDRHLVGEGPPVLLLAGEPGIGKSRLLMESQRRARTEGWTVLVGGCTRSGGQDPYAPLSVALEERLRRSTVAQVRHDLEGCAWLARLLPEVSTMGAEPLPTWTLAPSQERRLVVRAVERYLRNAAGPRGAVLVFDDMQWAGPDGLELLSALTELAEEIPLRVIAAYRRSEAPPGGELSDLIADLLSRGRALRLVLDPLPPDAAEMLLDNLLAGRPDTAGTRARVLQKAAGLPFFLVSYAQSLTEDGVTLTIPETVAASIRLRISALPVGAREVLHAAAVVGRVVDRTLLLTLLDGVPIEMLGALEATCQAQLLEEEGGTAYRFVHDLVRDVVEQRLSTARRAILHQRVAATLEARMEAVDVELLAYHYTRSDSAHKAIEYLERAGDHARSVGATNPIIVTWCSAWRRWGACLTSRGSMPSWQNF